MSLCCCCPPAISALLCLYCQSGCRQGTVAGALTFFPPEPPLYELDRYQNGRLLAENEEARVYEKDSGKDTSSSKDGKESPTATDPESADPQNAPDSSSLEPTDTSTHHLEDTETKGQTQEQMKSPIQQLTEQAAERRRRAKIRHDRDTRDTAAGVTYQLRLDERLQVPSYDAHQVQAVKIPNAQGSHVAAILYQVPPAHRTPETRTIIYSHGNATDIGAMFPLQVVLVHALHVNVVMYDYSGYGASGGVPEEAATYADLQAVFDYVVEHVQSDATRIVLYGQSVGSGPCTYLAARDDRIGGLVLHSAFTSGMRVLTPSRLLACLDIYPNIDRIKHVNCPVFVLHGKLDQEVDISHGRDLYEATPEEFKREPWWVPDRGHNDITDGSGKLAEYVRRLRSFLASLDD